jgi:hypothetical protein
MVVGSRLRTGDASAGARPTSSILVSIAVFRGIEGIARWLKRVGEGGERK